MFYSERDVAGISKGAREYAQQPDYKEHRRYSKPWRKGQSFSPEEEVSGHCIFILVSILQG